VNNPLTPARTDSMGLEAAPFSARLMTPQTIIYEVAVPGKLSRMLFGRQRRLQKLTAWCTQSRSRFLSTSRLEPHRVPPIAVNLEQLPVAIHGGLNAFVVRPGKPCNQTKL
jgi:hypothetical protein